MTLPRINYHHRVFKAVSNASNGEVNNMTRFYYSQEGDIVTADYEGGEIVKGHLIALVDAQSCLNMRYHHVNKKGEIMTGTCHSEPETDDNGVLRLTESWQWTSGDLSSGKSVIEEIPNAWEDNWQMIKMKSYIQAHARPLEKAILALKHKMKIKPFIVESANELSKESQHLLEVLSAYQNADGGFGKGIEPDFLMKASSPIATSIGLRFLLLVEDLPEAQLHIASAVNYLENTYNDNRKGWFAVDHHVNLSPHAPWWHFDQTLQTTIIDRSWGNPSLELIGYLYRYRHIVKTLDIMALVAHAKDYIIQQQNVTSEHEVYAMIRFYAELGERERMHLKNHIKRHIDSVINYDIKAWGGYVPMPLHFFIIDAGTDWGIDEIALKLNRDFIFEQVKKTGGYLIPSWSWGQYDDAWQISKVHWQGILTLEAYDAIHKMTCYF